MAMANPKQKWTAEEEEALRAGIAKHGTAKWKNIQRDPQFNHPNINLKDKWRKLSIACRKGSEAKIPTDAVIEDTPKCSLDDKTVSNYDAAKS